EAEELAKTFFPPKPLTSTVPRRANYPQPLLPSLLVTEERVSEQIKRLSPYKAPGLDGIANVVFKKCTDELAPILAEIFTVAIQLGLYHDSWKESITCVLQKPGKPNYQLTKVYRPIALLSTTMKLLSAIVADDMSRIIETNSLLPNTHFGG
ncbi:hypothetical protein FA15DRAFT_554345, partial [Coprinopsis marcescibilis]